MDPLKVLEEKQIGYHLYEHEAVLTVEEARRWTSQLPGMHCKNLFLKNRNGKRYFLLVFEERRPINLKALSTSIGVSNLSFASEERLYEYLKLKPGSVSPLGLINDTDRYVEVYFGKEVYDSTHSAFHPNINTRTLVLETKALIGLIEDLGYHIKII